MVRCGFDNRRLRRSDPEKVIKNVGKCVAALRVARGLTQQELADQLGITVNYVQRIEIGGSNLTMHTLVRWANWLDVEPAQLLMAPVGPVGRSRPKKKK